MECRFGRECVVCVTLEHILHPPYSLLHSDLVLGQQWLPSSQHTVDLLCCVCANVDGVPLQKSVKTANGFSLYFAIVMDVSVHSSCFAYSEDQIVAFLVPQNSKPVGSARDQTETFPEKPLIRLLAFIVGGLVLELWGSP